VATFWFWCVVTWAQVYPNLIASAITFVLGGLWAYLRHFRPHKTAMAGVHTKVDALQADITQLVEMLGTMADPDGGHGEAESADPETPEPVVGHETGFRFWPARAEAFPVVERRDGVGDQTNPQ